MALYETSADGFVIFVSFVVKIQDAAPGAAGGLRLRSSGMSTSEQVAAGSATSRLR